MLNCSAYDKKDLIFSAFLTEYSTSLQINKTLVNVTFPGMVDALELHHMQGFKQ